MKHRAFLGGVLVLVAAWMVSPRHAPAQVGVERKVVLQQDARIPGHDVVLAEVNLAVGGREGRHLHSGTLVAYVLEGELTLELEGQPTRILKAGQASVIEPRQVHEGLNKSTVPMKALVTFIVPKGQPLTTPAP